MSPTVVAIIVISLIVVAGVAITIARSRRRERLQQHFGPEYERQLRDAQGDHGKAESALLKREKRVEKFDIRPLSPEQRTRFLDGWREVQAKFVDDPERSIAFADALIAEVMKARGYPVEDFEQRAADLSVEHPQLVQDYRAAHELAVRHARGEGGTEDLRQGLIRYRSLFDVLLQVREREAAH